MNLIKQLIKKEILTIAHKMLQDGISIEKIKAYTGVDLSKE